MSQSHPQHDHGRHSGTTKNLRTAFFLNIAFTLIEIVGGFYTNSIAILSDALHDLGDSLSLGISWYFQHISTKNPDSKFTYGYKRYSVIGALLTSIVLLIGSIFIILELIPRFFKPELADAQGMILLSVLGIFVNGAAVLKLQNGSTLNEKAVRIHLMEDVLGWFAVLIGAIVMYFFNWPIIDPILSLLIAIYILFNVYRNLRDVMQVILQGVPEDVLHEKIIVYFNNLDTITDFHDLHIWSLDGNYNILSTHLRLKENLSNQEVALLKKKIRNQLLELNVHHATLEFDYPDIDCDFKENFQIH